jgi:CubicO group peptidase (beta-lactamase class C family)
VSSLVPLPSQPNGLPFPGAEWPVGSPVGVDEERLSAEIDRAFASEAGATNSDGLGLSLSLVIVQGGRIVAERYGPTSGPDVPLISWSMAKSFTQALVGMLLADGRLDLGPAPVPEWRRVADDPRAAITLDHLLMMRSGLRWAEEYGEDESGQVVSDVLEMLFGDAKVDAAAYATGKPLAHPPGRHHLYSSGTTNIVARIIGDALVDDPDADASGREAATRRFMHERLFDPLGMTSADPRFDAAGTFLGSSFLYATARDYARFGLLYLRDGVWDGRRLLPEGWVDRARTPHAPSEDFLDFYGHHWWIYPCPHGSFRASGYEGQAIVVVPGLDLVIVRLGKTPYANGPEPVFCHLAELVSCFAAVAQSHDG